MEDKQNRLTFLHLKKQKIEMRRPETKHAKKCLKACIQEIEALEKESNDQKDSN